MSDPQSSEPSALGKLRRVFDTVLALLDGSVRDVSAALPDLSDEDLARLKQSEEAGKTRKGVMQAIAEEALKRAVAKTEGDQVEAKTPAEQT